MNYIAIIPARYNSSRFPGKPLALLGGKPIIQRVYERASKSFSSVFVATDDDRIAQCVKNFGGQAIMTRRDHKSGTDRICEAYEKCGVKADVVVNVQGDEPFISSAQLEEIKHCFEDSRTQIATLVQPFAPTDDWDTLSNPNSPKVVVDSQDFALYFSRSVIPYLRGLDKSEWLTTHTFYKHIGLYAYRVETLRLITSFPQSTLEKAESLEQLRWLEAGLRIKVGYTNVQTIGIDTIEDLHRAEIFLSGTFHQA